MLLFVGLGNPGPTYAGNRHNLGFMAVDAIARAHGFGPWRRKFSADLAEGTLEGQRVLLLKPQTYMNNSGQSVAEAARFFRIPPPVIVVFYDELDLAPGKLKVKSGGGAAGHNGLRSLDAHLGTNAYRRVRLGIGHPGHKDRVSGYVLSDFAKSDGPWVGALLDAVAAEAPWLARGDDLRFASDVAARLNPPRPAKPKPAGTGPADTDGSGA